MLDEEPHACANIHGPMSRLGNWLSERSEAEGAGLQFKADAALYRPATGRLARLSPGKRPRMLPC
jgi:hypothetical protein